MSKNVKKKLDRMVECVVCEKWLKRQTSLRKHFVRQHLKPMGIGETFRPKLHEMYRECNKTKEYPVCGIRETIDIDTENGDGPMVMANFTRKFGVPSWIIQLREVYDSELWTKYVTNAATAHGGRHTVESREKGQRFYEYTKMLEEIRPIEEATENWDVCCICQKDMLQKEHKLSTFFKNNLKPCHPTSIHRIHTECLEHPDYSNALSCPYCRACGFYL